jgi:methionyl-tRNA formyltransferase
VVRIAVFAYHSVGCAGLKALLASGDEIALVITHRDSPSENLWFDSVAGLARDHALPLAFAEDTPPEALVERVLEMAPEIIYSFYYRNLLSEEILRLPRLGAFNLHGSLLPRYRGRCPVNWAIINREEVTGITLHAMVKQPDAGDIVAQKEITIDPRETALSLFTKMIPASAALVSEIHPLIREGRAPRKAQDPSQATVFPGRRPGDGEIDWTEDARDIDALVRAVTKPYPGAFTFLQGRKAFIWEAWPDRGTGNQDPGVIRSIAPLKVTAGKGVLCILTAEYDNGDTIASSGTTVPKGIKEGNVFGSNPIPSSRKHQGGIS